MLIFIFISLIKPYQNQQKKNFVYFIAILMNLMMLLMLNINKAYTFTLNVQMLLGPIVMSGRALILH